MDNIHVYLSRTLFMGVSNKDDYSFLAMGMYICVALLMVTAAFVEAATRWYPRPTCPTCLCRVQAKPQDAKHNALFAKWFNAVFDKRILTCPFTTFPKLYYGYRGSRCECAEEKAPVLRCSLRIYQLAAASPHDKVYLCLLFLCLLLNNVCK